MRKTIARRILTGWHTVRGEASAAARTAKSETALYTYLSTTLKSKRLRRMLEEGANEHQSAAEAGVAR